MLAVLLLECGISCGTIKAQKFPVFFNLDWMYYRGADCMVSYEPTAEKYSLIYFVENDYAKISGSFLYSTRSHA